LFENWWNLLFLEVSKCAVKQNNRFFEHKKKQLNLFQIQRDFFQRTYKLIMTLSVLSLKKTVLNDPTIKVFKRLFDVVFSIVIIGLCPGWCHFGDFNKTGIKRAGVLDKEGRDRWKRILLLQV
jgi:hypothetical protein